jgi:sugar lactone lactonase YvrE
MKAASIAVAFLALLALYLLAWPTGMEPVAWTPPPAPRLEGVYAYNEKLKGIQTLLEGIGTAPEGINVDAVGRIYAGYADGRVVQAAFNGASYIEMANTRGRPLGITFGPNGGLVIADSRRGLLHLGNKVRELVTEAEGVSLRYTNDADNTRLDKNIYFTDSSSKFGTGHFMTDLLEHGANGRLLQYNVATRETHVLMKDLHFPNGVAVGPDDAYVLVSETAEYRVLRYWLKGDMAGTSEVFIENLPGFPDNLSYNDRDRFWLALASPRSATLDGLLPGSALLRKVLGRLPSSAFPEGTHAFVLALDLEGKVISNLQYSGTDAYAPITSVREHGPWLYFGSNACAAIGRIPLNQVVPGAQSPPAGWENVAAPKQLPMPRSRKDEEEERRGKGEEDEE